MSKFIGYKYRIDGKRIIIYGVRKNLTLFQHRVFDKDTVDRIVKIDKEFPERFLDKEIILIVKIARDEMIEKGLIDE